MVRQEATPLWERWRAQCHTGEVPASRSLPRHGTTDAVRIEEAEDDEDLPDVLQRSCLEPDDMKPTVLALCEEIANAIEQEHEALHSNIHGTRSQRKNTESVRPGKRRLADEDVLPTVAGKRAHDTSKKRKISNSDGNGRRESKAKGKGHARRR